MSKRIRGLRRPRIGVMGASGVAGRSAQSGRSGVVGALMVLALVGGCSPGEELPNPRAIASQLKCESTYEAGSIEGLPTVEVGTCRLNRETVRLLVFVSTDARNAFRELSKGSGTRFVEGNELLVEVRGAATAALVQDRL